MQQKFVRGSSGCTSQMCFGLKDMPSSEGIALGRTECCEVAKLTGELNILEKPLA